MKLRSELAGLLDGPGVLFLSLALMSTAIGWCSGHPRAPAKQLQFADGRVDFAMEKGHAHGPPIPSSTGGIEADARPSFYAVPPPAHPPKRSSERRPPADQRPGKLLKLLGAGSLFADARLVTHQDDSSDSDSDDDDESWEEYIMDFVYDLLDMLPFDVELGEREKTIAEKCLWRTPCYTTGVRPRLKPHIDFQLHDMFDFDWLFDWIIDHAYLLADHLELVREPTLKEHCLWRRSCYATGVRPELRPTAHHWLHMEVSFDWAQPLLNLLEPLTRHIELETEMSPEQKCLWRRSCYETGVRPEIAGYDFDLPDLVPHWDWLDWVNSHFEMHHPPTLKEACRWRASCYKTGVVPELHRHVFDHFELPLIGHPVEAFESFMETAGELFNFAPEPSKEQECLWRKSCYETGVLPEILHKSERLSLQTVLSGWLGFADVSAGLPELVTVEKTMEELCLWRKSCYADPEHRRPKELVHEHYRWFHRHEHKDEDEVKAKGKAPAKPAVKTPPKPVAKPAPPPPKPKPKPVPVAKPAPPPPKPKPAPKPVPVKVKDVPKPKPAPPPPPAPKPVPVAKPAPAPPAPKPSHRAPPPPPPVSHEHDDGAFKQEIDLLDLLVGLVSNE